jgi:hypothetical protein
MLAMASQAVRQGLLVVAIARAIESLPHIARAIESLPHIARAHISRWGDGGAHLRLFFFARPAGFAQLRGTCLAIWDDLLPAVPASQRDADAAAIGEALTAGPLPHPGKSIK